MSIPRALWGTDSDDYNEQQREAFQDAINDSAYCNECMAHVDEVDGVCGECGLELTAPEL